VSEWTLRLRNANRLYMDEKSTGLGETRRIGNTKKERTVLQLRLTSILQPV